MRLVIKNRVLKFVVSTFLFSLIFLPLCEAQAGIHGTLCVRNSRSSVISVTVEKSNGTLSYYNVDARSSTSIEVNDTPEGSTWLYAYSGYDLIKSEMASGSYSSYTWWVD